MYKYFFNPKKLQRSFSHIGPRFHNRKQMFTQWKHSGCPFNFFGKSFIFLGGVGIIINSVDIIE